MDAPTGLALYLRALSKKRHGTPKELAKKLADAGLRWAAIGGPWHDDPKKGNRWLNRPEEILRYSEALAAAGVQAHVWGYPWHDRVDAFVEDLLACTGPATSGWLLDPELGFKGHVAEAGDLFRKSRAALEDRNPYIALGLTSYGLPRGHRSFPFEAFAEPGVEGDPLVECDYGSPQLYDVPEKRVLEGLADYAELGFDAVVPSFGVYKFVKADPALPLSGKNRKAVSKTPEELEAHLGDFIDSPVEVRGLIGWAFNFVNPGLWRVLSRWAERLDRGACALPPR